MSALNRLALICAGVWFLATWSLASALPIGPSSPITVTQTPDFYAGNYPGFATVNGYADGFFAADGVITSSSNSFTSASRNCNASTDPGKIIEIAGAGATVSSVQQPLETTVSSCSGTAFILAATASNSVSSVLWAYGTDDSAALNAAIAANPQKRILMPPGIVMLRSTTVALQNINIECTGTPNNDVALVTNYAQYGTTFVMASTSVNPFVTGYAQHITGCNFFWPGQAGINSNPVIYPPLLTDVAGSYTGAFSGLVFDHNTVVNAYDFITQAGTDSGNIKFTDDNVYAVRRVFSWQVNNETMNITNFLSNPSIFTQPSGPEGNLVTYTQNNGNWFYVFGDGATPTCPTSVTGGILGVNLTVENYYSKIHVATGILQESSFHFGSTGGVPIPLSVDASGLIQNVTVDDGEYISGMPIGDASNNTAFQINSTCSTNTTGNTLKVSGKVAGANGTVFDIEGTTQLHLVVRDFWTEHYAWSSTRTPNYYFAIVNNPSATVDILDNVISQNPNVSLTAYGILGEACTNLNIRNNTFNYITNPIDTNGAGACPITVSNNTTQNTKSTYSVYNISQGVRFGYNNFDVPPQGGNDPGGVAFQILDNGDMQIDQAHEGASATFTSATYRLVDRWALNDTAGASVTAQRILESPPSTFPGHEYYLKLTMGGTAVTPSAAQLVNVHQVVETPNGTDMSLGSSVASSLILDYCAKTSVAGQYSFYMTNAGAYDAIVLPFTLAANTSTCGSITIPPPDSQSNGWSPAWGNSFQIGLDLGSGSNYTAAAAGTWEAAGSLLQNVSGNVVWTANAAATFELTGLRLRTQYMPAYFKRSYVDELAHAQRCYTKSFSEGTAPAQNTGNAHGAKTFLVPYAESTFATAGVWVDFPRTMFVNATPTYPSIVFYSPNDATADAYDTTQPGDLGAVSAINVGANGFMASVALHGASINAAVGDQAQFHWTADGGC